MSGLTPIISFARIKPILGGEERSGSNDKSGAKRIVDWGVGGGESGSTERKEINSGSPDVGLDAGPGPPDIHIVESTPSGENPSDSAVPNVKVPGVLTPENQTHPGAKSSSSSTNTVNTHSGSASKPSTAFLRLGGANVNPSLPSSAASSGLFDFMRAVVPPEASQAQVYDSIAGGESGLVEKWLNGFDVDLLCYGQTGSGKTFTWPRSGHGA
jgi:hypothetical protein